MMIEILVVDLEFVAFSYCFGGSRRADIAEMESELGGDGR